MYRFLLILIILTAIGCAHVSEYPLPDPSEYSTVTGQRCAIKCREIDYDGKMACQGTKSEQATCGSECNQKLDLCYQLCIETFEE